MMEITRLVQSLELPKESYIVVGGGILTALKLRKLHDIDILVTDEVFESFGKAGWAPARWSGRKGLRRGVFELGTEVRGYRVADLKDMVTVIEGISYLKLELVYCIKQKMRRPNDVTDLQLIEAYQANPCSECMARARVIVQTMRQL